MKTIDGPSRTIRIIMVVLLSVLIIGCGIVYRNYATYNSIDVVTKKNAAIEYGSANYDIHDFIKKVEGEIVSIKNDIDTSHVGEQEVLVKVKKDNIIKEVPILIPVVDTVAPVIQLKDSTFTVTRGNAINLLEIIDFVRDDVDGDLPFLEEIDENSRFYYHFEYDGNTIGDVGEHEVGVVAVDRNGNTANASFILKVNAPPVVSLRQSPIYYHLPANPSGNDLVSIAYSLVGSPYISGSNGPYGFDCSGFVQYVYAQVGIHVSRSSSTQIYDGYGVSYEEAQPGDILSWGAGSPSHSALYIGNGLMIHATNPRQGVIVSDIAGWTRGSGTHILSVRRIQ